MVAPNTTAERFARWHGAHAGALHRGLRSRCEARRADAVQETWLAVLRAPPPDDVANDETRLRAYLVCIAQRREVDLARRDRSPAPLSGTEVARDSGERDERTGLVRAALDVLATTSAAAAQLLERHFIDELPVHELAKELGLTASVVSARLTRAKKKLRAILEEMGGWVATLERIRKKFGIARRIRPRRATTRCPRPFNRRFTMSAKRKLAGTALLLALLVCTMGADAVFFDANQPTPNPGGVKAKISAAGTYTTDAGHEQAGISFTADDGIFGVNYIANTNKTLKTWNLPASNLSAGTYDCQASMGVDDGTKLWQVKSAVVKGVKVN